MKRIVKYTATDPYYSDITQTYIGSTPTEIDNIQFETEEFMAKEYVDLGMIYNSEIIFDNSEFFL